MQNLTPSRFLLIVLGTLSLCLSNISQAQMAPFGFPNMAQPYNPGYSNPYGANPYFGGPAPFIGENASNEASLINCRCAALVMNGKEDEDLSCANFKKLYQQQIMNAGSVGVINAPAQTSLHQ